MTVPVLAVDHVGVTVPNLDAAVELMVTLFGARELYRREYRPVPGGEEMRRQFDIHPQSSFRLSKVELAGRHLELFEYAAPDQRAEPPRACDAGGHHLALLVSDIDAAVDALRADGRVRVLGEVQTLVSPHPLAGRRWVYTVTPWGLALELVCDPA